ncbi:hypothetical protein PCC7424_5231 [Gloeothece citriformis PCC 7424]|uniref:Uncharacterized protein n=1 Tax=Gloeothece citriformis (strain PCC 7424) TaxID=65393 RepID=B7KI92_GLOC7|nr:hypothetical protein [Gloeothece citriformis]ACK73579.1 hypothetical protein PCC7424_5231 [Gloeothece citriformis PCC 7424]
MNETRPDQSFVSQPSSYSPLLNEIRDEFSLDEIQAFGDEHYWNEDSDLEFLYQTTSEDYVDFLLSYE